MQWSTQPTARQMCQHYGNQIQQDIQIFRDSKVVIDWENGRTNIQVPYLQHVLTKIQNLKTLFRRISFAHIYREVNEEADSLSKQALAYQPGIMEIEETATRTSRVSIEMI